MSTPKSTPEYCSILGNSPEPLSLFLEKHNQQAKGNTQDKPKQPSKSVSKWIEEGFSPIDKPTKQDKPKGKPINGYDRLNALIRIPEIQRELEAIEKESGKTKRTALELSFFDKYKIPAKLLKHPEVFNKHKYWFDVNTIHIFSGFEKSDLDSISKYRDGKHVIIAVDMSKKRKDITREFNEVLTRISKDYKIPKDKTRDSVTTQEIWKVFDSSKNDKKSYVQIAKETSKKNLDSQDSQVKQVIRAYKKADDITRRIRKKDE